MTRNELTASLIQAGIYFGSWDLDDVTYEPVSPSFVMDAAHEFPSFLPPELRTMRDIGGAKTIEVPKWIEESFDCDNIARAFGVYTDICMARDAVITKRTRGNIAAGKINFMLNPTAGHAINWFVGHDGAVFLIDAANPNEFVMSAEQRQSVSSGESI